MALIVFHDSFERIGELRGSSAPTGQVWGGATGNSFMTDGEDAESPSSPNSGGTFTRGNSIAIGTSVINVGEVRLTIPAFPEVTTPSESVNLFWTRSGGNGIGVQIRNDPFSPTARYASLYAYLDTVQSIQIPLGSEYFDTEIDFSYVWSEEELTIDLGDFSQTWGISGAAFDELGRINSFGFFNQYSPNGLRIHEATMTRDFGLLGGGGSTPLLGSFWG